MRLLCAFVLLVAASSCACAQDRADVERAWASYDRYFLTRDGKGGSFFAMSQGAKEDAGFWEEIEEIEVVEDHFDWVVRSGLKSDAARDEVNALCVGFVNRRGTDWGAKNRFNDDLNWAAIAFARAYGITKNAAWLADVRLNFDNVFQRGSTGNGGIAQTQPPVPMTATWAVNEDAPANFAFVIAGYTIFANGGGEKYKDEADGVYRWSIANLYSETEHGGGPCPKPHADRVCGKVIDSSPSVAFTAPMWKQFPNKLRMGPWDYTYNYGIAIKAAVMVGGSENLKIAQNVANRLMFRFGELENGTWQPNSYVGVFGGWNVIPDYKAGGKNNAGYNGIGLRGVGYGLRAGALDATTLEWMRANVAAAWSVRNSDGVMWNVWNAKTPAEGLFSWDASAALAGMLDLPGK